MRKKSTSKATATIKETTTKATEAVKETEEKTIAKAPEVIEEAKDDASAIELPGFAVTMSSIEEAIKEDIKAKDIKGKDISVYVNVEQKAAYYTVDGQGSDDYKIDLNTL